ncbi:MAG TPA: CHAT domain-containing protein [Thermoanaerobaculia bacterium]
MTTSFAFRSAAPLLSSCLVALLAIGLCPGRAAAAPQAASPAVEAEALELKPDLHLEREIRPGMTRAFGLRLSAGAFLYLEISPRDLSLLSRLLGPDGKELAVAEGSDSQLLVARVDRDCACRLEITARGAKVSELFGLRVLDLRPARPEDEARVTGAALLAEVRRLSALQEAGAKERAVTLAAESLAAWRKSNDARGEVEALFARAALQTAQGGDMKGALPWYEEALKRAREGGLLREQALALSNLGYCYRKLGQDQSAVTFYQESRKIWDQIGGPYDRASIRQSLGNFYVYATKPDYEMALRTFEEARVAAEASGDLAQLCRALSGIGASHYYLSHLGQARETWERALNVSRQAGDPVDEVLLEQNLAVLYMNQGELQTALDLYIRLAPNTSPGTENAKFLRYNMGLAYLELGSPDKALESFELARAASHAVGDADYEVASMIGIGRAYQKKGDPQAALAEYRRAQGIPPGERWSVLHSIGLGLIDLSRPAEALPPLQKALELARASRSRSQEGATLLSLGRAHAALGQAGPEKESLDQAIAVAKEIDYQAVVAPALLWRARLARGQGRLEEARKDIEEALQVVESTRRGLAGDSLRVGFFATKRSYYDLDIDLLLALDQRHPETDQYRALAFEASERARARGLLDLLAEGRIDLSQGLDPDLRRRDTDLSSQLSRAQRDLESSGMKPDQLARLQTEARKLDEEREHLDLEIRTRNQRYAEVRYPVPLKLQEVQGRLLDDRTALLELSLGEKRSTLFVVTRGQLKVYPLPAAAAISQRVRRLRADLERDSLSTQRDYRETAFELYQDLLAPASDALEGRPNLIIVPDGVLYYVPFETLLTEPAKGRSWRDLPYLLRRHSVAYVPSASVLAGLREPRPEPARPARKQVAAFAPFATAGAGGLLRGPAPDTAHRPAPSQRFKPLPASSREVSEISHLYPEAALQFLGGEANESTFKHDPQVAAARRLHLATHAEIDEARPELSALILSPGGGGEDGYLDVREIFGLKLSAELAVLSACETGLGKQVTGEGLVGLTRAFFYAGVPSLVVSLWNVVDGPTPELMRDFYSGMDQLQDKSGALRRAKLTMIDRGTYAYPTYWAPFILLGEPQ